MNFTTRQSTASISSNNQHRNKQQQNEKMQSFLGEPILNNNINEKIDLFKKFHYKPQIKQKGMLSPLISQNKRLFYEQLEKINTQKFAHLKQRDLTNNIMIKKDNDGVILKLNQNQNKMQFYNQKRAVLMSRNQNDYIINNPWIEDNKNTSQYGLFTPNTTKTQRKYYHTRYFSQSCNKDRRDNSPYLNYINNNKSSKLPIQCLQAENQYKKDVQNKISRFNQLLIIKKTNNQLKNQDKNISTSKYNLQKVANKKNELLHIQNNIERQLLLLRKSYKEKEQQRAKELIQQFDQTYKDHYSKKKSIIQIMAQQKNDQLTQSFYNYKEKELQNLLSNRSLNNSQLTITTFNNVSKKQYDSIKQTENNEDEEEEGYIEMQNKYIHSQKLQQDLNIQINFVNQ